MPGHHQLARLLTGGAVNYTVVSSVLDRSMSYRLTGCKQLKNSKQTYDTFSQPGQRPP